MSSGKSVHFSSEKQTWETPQDFFDKVNDIFNFTLDACAEDNTAKVSNYFTVEDDALTKDWKGVVWCNPPYGKIAELWLQRMAIHNNGIALIFARTETEMFFNFVWDRATSLLFIKGRLHFHYVSGEKAKANSGAPSVLIAYGDEADARLRKSSIKGKYIHLKHNHYERSTEINE